MFAGKQVAQVLPNLGIGIHRRPWFKVGVSPSTESEAIGTQFSHAAQPNVSCAPEAIPFPQDDIATQEEEPARLALRLTKRPPIRRTYAVTA
ncbi:hypothetical protein, partial [Rugosimonospora africana]|uniref:hypothetical protein n=1 Tax=Rugosimonospora africana TaxID=556532 RepID=UPI001EF1F662